MERRLQPAPETKALSLRDQSLHPQPGGMNSALHDGTQQTSWSAGFSRPQRPKCSACAICLYILSRHLGQVSELSAAPSFISRLKPALRKNANRPLKWV